MSTNTSNNRVSVDVLVRAESNEFFVGVAVASDGDRIFAHGTFDLLRSDGNGFTKVNLGQQGTITDWRKGLVVADGALWVAGSGLGRSTDDGATFQPAALPEPAGIEAMAVEGGVALWVGGQSWVAGAEGTGVVFVKPTARDDFRKVKGPAAGITAMAPSQLGVLVGDEAGRVWVAANRAIEATPLDAGEPVRSICETSDGAIVVVTGTEDALPRVLRAARGAGSFEASRVDEDAYLITLCQLLGGPLVGGGWDDLVMVSFDDGRSFTRVVHEAGRGENFNFEASCVHGNAVLLTGNSNNLVSVSLAERARRR